MKKYFEKNYRKITYPIDTPKVKGLRNAQLGAIHAISSFFTLRKKEAAIVIMPTGAGKTAVLMLTPYLLRKNKVLIVTPSKMVRGQIFEDLSSLKTLCYIKWCDGIGKKISNKEIKVKTNTNFDFLPHPSALTEYPSNIFYADYSPKTYSSIPMVKCRGEETGFRLIDYIIKIVSSTKNKLQIELSAGENIEEIECDLSGRYKSITNILSVRNSVGWVGVADYLTDNPLIFRTLDDQTIEGINVLTGDFSENVFDNSIVEPINWETYGTDIHVEFGKSQNDTAISIQDALLEILKSKNQYDYIIFDHGTGELADYITIQETEHELFVELYHVKKMSGAQFNSNVNDIYEVAGQAIKSTSWFTTKGKFIQKIVDRHKAGHCQILVGGEYQQLIRNLRSSEKLLRGTIVIVQPAISVSIEIPNKIQQVLAATTTYIKRAGKVNALKIMGSK